MKRLCVVLCVTLVAVGLTFAQNLSTVEQTGHNNVADVTQLGIYNESHVVQLASEYPPNGMNASVMQLGEGNHVDVDMREHGQHFSTVLQFGANNEATVVHERNSGKSSIYQAGFMWGNKAEVRVHAINGSEVYVEQVGEQNEVQQDIGVEGTPMGGGNTLIARQTGGANLAVQKMFGTSANFSVNPDNDDNNRGEVDQFGAVQGAMQTFGDGVHRTADNTAKIMQDGIFNLAVTEQVGVGNTADVSQFVGGQFSMSTQVGNGNVAVVSQTYSLPSP